MKEQLLALAYEQEDEFGSSERDEFDCLIALIEDGTINTFEELAKYGVEKMNEGKVIPIVLEHSQPLVLFRFHFTRR